MMSQPSLSCLRKISFLRELEHINMKAVTSQWAFSLLLQISIDIILLFMSLTCNSVTYFIRYFPELILEILFDWESFGKTIKYLRQ
jgi:hypothetical protein